jgi:hypothetical protein
MKRLLVVLLLLSSCAWADTVTGATVNWLSVTSWQFTVTTAEHQYVNGTSDGPHPIAMAAPGEVWVGNFFTTGYSASTLNGFENLVLSLGVSGFTLPSNGAAFDFSTPASVTLTLSINSVPMTFTNAGTWTGRGVMGPEGKYVYASGASFVSAAAVVQTPEPSSLLLLLTGGYWLRLRRSRSLC